MSDPASLDASFRGDEELLKSLIDLERNTSAEIKRQRDAVRITQAAPVLVLPGNSTERMGRAIEGLTADLSEGGARLLMPMPLGVGDHYYFKFQGELDALRPVLGRCLRCRYLQEDAFEVGIKFSERVDLSNLMNNSVDIGGFDSLI